MDPTLVEQLISGAKEAFHLRAISERTLPLIWVIDDDAYTGSIIRLRLLNEGMVVQVFDSTVPIPTVLKYDLACAYIQLGQKRQALYYYEMIIGTHYHYRDVLAQVETIRRDLIDEERHLEGAKSIARFWRPAYHLCLTK